LAAAEAIGIVLAENMQTAATAIKPVLTMMVSSLKGSILEN